MEARRLGNRGRRRPAAGRVGRPPRIDRLRRIDRPPAGRRRVECRRRAAGPVRAEENHRVRRCVCRGGAEQDRWVWRAAERAWIKPEAAVRRAWRRAGAKTGRRSRRIAQGCVRNRRVGNAGGRRRGAETGETGRDAHFDRGAARRGRQGMPDRIVRAVQGAKTVPKGVMVQPRAERAEHEKAMNEHSTKMWRVVRQTRPAPLSGSIPDRIEQPLPRRQTPLAGARGAFGYGSSGADNAPKGFSGWARSLASPRPRRINRENR